LKAIINFEITNPEMPAEALGVKFYRLNINMKANGQRLDLEIQVSNEYDQPEHSLYYCLREYSKALVSD
jgi:hypothetical protein